MANEGYIPFGLDRSTRSMDKIQDARSRMRDANIRKSLVGGEMMQDGLTNAISQGAQAYSMASDRNAEAAAMDVKKKFNRARAVSEVDRLDSTIEAMEALLETTENPQERFDMQEKLAGYKNRRTMWAAARDAYNKEAVARVVTSQANADTKQAKITAAEKEQQASRDLVSSVLGNAGDADMSSEMIEATESLGKKGAWDTIKDTFTEWTSGPEETTGAIRDIGTVGDVDPNMRPIPEYDYFGGDVDLSMRPIGEGGRTEAEINWMNLDGPDSQMRGGLGTRDIGMTPQDVLGIERFGSQRSRSPSYPTGRKRSDYRRGRRAPSFYGDTGE